MRHVNPRDRQATNKGTPAGLSLKQRFERSFERSTWRVTLHSAVLMHAMSVHTPMVHIHLAELGLLLRCERLVERGMRLGFRHGYLRHEITDGIGNLLD